MKGWLSHDCCCSSHSSNGDRRQGSKDPPSICKSNYNVPFQRLLCRSKPFNKCCEYVKEVIFSITNALHWICLHFFPSAPAQNLDLPWIKIGDCCQIPIRKHQWFIVFFFAPILALTMYLWCPVRDLKKIYLKELGTTTPFSAAVASIIHSLFIGYSCKSSK